MSPAEFEPAIQESEQPQTNALDRVWQILGPEGERHCQGDGGSWVNVYGIASLNIMGLIKERRVSLAGRIENMK
jgi:hypothetical protein